MCIYIVYTIGIIHTNFILLVYPFGIIYRVYVLNWRNNTYRDHFTFFYLYFILLINKDVKNNKLDQEGYIVGFAAIIGLLGPIFTDLIKRIFPDPEKQAEAQIELQKLLGQAQVEAYKAEAVAMEAKKDVITTEMNTGGVVGQWRGYLMFMCMAMIGFNWIVSPILNALLSIAGMSIVTVPIPGEAWAVISIGLGGYLTKETMNVYSQGKVAKAQAENPAPIIDEDTLAKALRKNLFKDGMTQKQWDAILKSAKESVGGE